MRIVTSVVAVVVALAPALVRADEPKYESPQAVIAAGQAFVKDKKPEQLITIVQPKDRNFFAFSMVFGASFVAAFKGEEARKEFGEIMKKHKLDDKKVEGKGDEEQMRKQADVALEGVDKAALLKDVFAFMDKNSDPKKGSKLEAKFGEVKDVKIDGDKATGTGSDGKPVAFAKVDGGWFLAIDSGGKAGRAEKRPEKAPDKK